MDKKWGNKYTIKMRTDEYYGYIYCTVNLINGKVYIGQRKGKIESSKGYLGSGVILKKALNKYGRDSFKKEILYKSKSFEEQNEKEREFIEKYNKVGASLYNIEKGGNCIGKFTKEQRNKHSENNTGEKCFFYNKRGEDALNYNKEVSEETKKKISEKLIGEKSYLFGKKNELNHNSKPVYQIDIKTDRIIKTWSSSAEIRRELKIRHADEVCSGRRKTAGGFKWKHVEKEKIKKVAKSVYQINLKTNKVIRTWGSTTEAANALGIHGPNISAVCNNRKKTSYGFKWKYV